MKFQLRPILSEIKELYSKPISTDRFKEYISKLEGETKGDMSLPISGFNPMAKNHILLKIDELEKLDAEIIMQQAIIEFNLSMKIQTDDTFLVVLNLADDLKGSWTNFYSTDFDSKFKLNAFVTRNFCVPYFWTSEAYSKEEIKKRTIEYMNRILYWYNNSGPKTLEEHLEQEVFVAIKTNQSDEIAKVEAVKGIEAFYMTNLKSVEYDKIFNFFYGDAGSESLGYKKYDINELTGFDYAKFISNKRKVNSKH